MTRPLFDEEALTADDLRSRLLALPMEELERRVARSEGTVLRGAISQLPWCEHGDDTEDRRCALLAGLSELVLELGDARFRQDDRRARWFFELFAAITEDLSWMSRYLTSIASAQGDDGERRAAGGDVFFALELLSRLHASFDPLVFAAGRVARTEQTIDAFLETVVEPLATLAPFQADVLALAQRLPSAHPLRDRLVTTSSRE